MPNKKKYFGSSKIFSFVVNILLKYFWSLFINSKYLEFFISLQKISFCSRSKLKLILELSNDLYKIFAD